MGMQKEHVESPPSGAVALADQRYDQRRPYIPSQDLVSQTNPPRTPSLSETDNRGSATENYFHRELQELDSLAPELSMQPIGSRPRYIFRTGARYLGQWKGNARHGMGEQIWNDGATFAGQWKDN